MPIMTTLGPIDAALAGVTLMHEHLLIDVSYKWQRPTEVTLRALAEQPITLANLGYLRRNIGAIKANLRLDDVDTAAAEAMAFKREGGGTIVDVSTVGIGRDPRALRAIALQAGINVVTCTGFYLQRSHPPAVAAASVEQLAGEMIAEIQQGIGDTAIRPGIIGEIGLGEPMYAAGHTGDEMHPDEAKVLRAAGWAQQATGLPITLHIYNYRPNRLAHLALDVLEHEGVNLARVVVGHLDNRIDVEYAASVMDRGAYAEFDTFGIEASLDATLSEYPRDTERIRALVELISRGYVEQLLVSHDVCTKMQLAAYGGWGYGHLSRHIEPRLRKAGVSDDQLTTIRISNPRRLLDVCSPAEKGQHTS
jgi:phosphotriesterase-related protein